MNGDGRTGPLSAADVEGKAEKKKAAKAAKEAEKAAKKLKKESSEFQDR